MQIEDRDEELTALRRQLASQAEEIERLRSASGGRPSRRALLTGGAAMAGGMFALSAASAAPAHGAPGHELIYPQAGETAHLFLSANGENIPGDSTRTSLGRADSIECFYFQQKVRTTGTTRSSTLEYDDVIIRKSVDRATPRIAQAHDTQAALSGQFWFFRPNPAGDGTTEQHFRILFGGGRVVSRNIYLPDLMAGADRGSGGGAPYEEIGLRLSRLTWTYTNGGVTWGG